MEPNEEQPADMATSDLCRRPQGCAATDARKSLLVTVESASSPRRTRSVKASSCRRFYRNEVPDVQGRMLATLQGWSHEELECAFTFHARYQR